MIDSRANDDGQAIRRRCQCPRCSRRLTTIETASLQVIKWSGAHEPFSRGKIISRVGRTRQGHFVDEDNLARFAQLVEERIRTNGASQTEAHGIGLVILEPPHKLGTIAYLCFASVYSSYDSSDDLKNVARELHKNPSESVK